jgi:hypothetical protein
MRKIQPCKFPDFGKLFENVVYEGPLLVEFCFTFLVASAFFIYFKMYMYLVCRFRCVYWL